MQCFALCEAEKFHISFKHDLQPTKPGNLSMEKLFPTGNQMIKWKNIFPYKGNQMINPQICDANEPSFGVCALPS